MGLPCQRCQRRSCLSLSLSLGDCIARPLAEREKDEGWSPPSTVPTLGHLPERWLAASHKDY